MAGGTSQGDAAPTTIAGRYSPYEQASIDQALARLARELDPTPEGKTVEGIDVVTLDVIEPRDPAPNALNALHATTRHYVIEREVLLRAGEPYRGVGCDETARNLRQLPQLSLVLCTATRGASDQAVRVLVITKDVWSLRLGWDVVFVGNWIPQVPIGTAVLSAFRPSSTSSIEGKGGFESLQLVPTETNLGGTHQIALLRYIYQPESQSIALGYRIPRLAGRRISLAAESGVTWNRQGEAEGSNGSLAVTQPLYSARTEWAWAAGTLWRNEVVRRYQDAKLYVDSHGVPFEYRSERAAIGVNVTRSFGWAIKHDFTLGAEMNLRTYLPPDVPVRDDSGGGPLRNWPTLGPRLPSQADLDAFTRRYVPTSDRRVGPFVQYRTYTSNFLRVLNVETLGLQEDFRLGHDVAVRFYPIREELGSTRSFLGTLAVAQYTLGIADGFARASVMSTIEAEAGGIADASIDTDLHVVTPQLGIGRIVLDGGVLDRYRNYLNRTSYLGGTGRLRGYPSNFFAGKDVVAYNAEFRSRPTEILSCQLGGAFFIDGGHAADSMDHLAPRHSVGLGLRILFPQLDRLVFRADIGFPLQDRSDPRVSPFAVTVAFEQAFAVPAVSSQVATGSATGWIGQ